MGAKYKEVTNIFPEDKTRLWSFKKVKEKQLKKYHRKATVKIGGDNLCERCMYTEQDCLMHNSR